jgi:SAM-dependent methyltransferase
VSPFSAVDASPDPATLVAYLDTIAAGLAGMKHYVAAAAARAVPGGRVLDVGCGAGHDLALMAAAGLQPLGIDPSGAMLAAAADRAGVPAARGPLVRGDGGRLPFRSGSLDGCRIERVLQHVDSPERVIDEVARVLRPGGFLAVFEPDWASLRFGDGDGGTVIGSDDSAVAAALVSVRQPDVVARLAGLADTHGLRIVDRVVEASCAYALADHPLPVEAALARSVSQGRLDASAARRWWARQQALDRQGRFRASWSKVLVVAHRLA